MAVVTAFCKNCIRRCDHIVLRRYSMNLFPDASCRKPLTIKMGAIGADNPNLDIKCYMCGFESNVPEETVEWRRSTLPPTVDELIALARARVDE
jgi:hypothetical protein